MKKVIITTVGTSLLSNLIRRENAKGFRFNISEDDIEDIANGLLEEEFSELSEYCKTIILASDQSIKRVCFDEIYQLNLDASAEIKSICKIATGTPATVYLLATDTFMSEYAAEQITKHLNVRNNLEVINKGRIKNLTIDDPELFEQSGFEELLNKLEEIRGNHKGDDIILNISGGYKALIPFLTIYAQVNKLLIKYIYEGSDKVVTIGKTPLDFDWELIEQNYFALEKFGDQGDKSPQLIAFKERLAEYKEDQDKLFKELNEKGIITKAENDKVKLTNLGQLYIQAYTEKFHSSNFNRKSLHSKLIEYLVFEYYQSEYPGKAIIGYTPQGTDYDIDVFVETNDTIIVIEVKPAGNIPIKRKGKKEDSDTIESKLIEGSFKHLVHSLGNNKNIRLKYVCYGPLGVHPSPAKEIEKLLVEMSKFKVSKDVSFELCHLKTPSNFKSNTNWKVDTNHSIRTLFSNNLKQN